MTYQALVRQTPNMTEKKVILTTEDIKEARIVCQMAVWGFVATHSQEGTTAEEFARIFDRVAELMRTLRASAPGWCVTGSGKDAAALTVWIRRLP